MVGEVDIKEVIGKFFDDDRMFVEKLYVFVFDVVLDLVFCIYYGMFVWGCDGKVLCFF